MGAKKIATYVAIGYGAVGLYNLYNVVAPGLKNGQKVTDYLNLASIKFLALWPINWYQK